MYNKSLLRLASELRAFNTAFSEGKCRIIDNKVYNSKFLFYHFFYWSSKFFKNDYRKLLIDYFDKSEKRYPGSSYFLSVKLCDQIYGNTHIEKPIKAERNYDIIMKYLSTLTDKKNFELFNDILEFSGADATITCEKTKNSGVEVSKVCLPKFEFKLDDSFKHIFFSAVQKTTKDFIVSIVDGFIERESEIYTLIEYAKKTNLPVILICRGISDHAKSNIKQIMLKNSVYIYPYVEAYNNEDPFKIKDFAAMIDIKVISSEYSDSVNKDIVSKTKIVNCTLSSNDITVKRSTNDVVIKEINSQIEKNTGNTALLDYLRKRKMRCMPNNTIVKIPERSIRSLNEIKSLIKCYNFCAVRGVYRNENTLMSVQCEKITNTLSKNLYNNIKSISFKIKTGEKDAS